MHFEWDFSELVAVASRLESLGEFEKHMSEAAKRISKALLKWMKEFTPTDSYELVSGWDGNQFAITKKGNVFEVLIVNKTPYALPVNDGHKAYNQFGGPYPVKRRIKVRSAHQWQTDASEWYVFGHFFVERGIIRLKDTKEIEQIIMDELQKWWASV